MALLFTSEEAETKENRGTTASHGQAQSSPPRQPFRTSQPPHYSQRQPQAGPQPEPWGQSNAQHPPWDLPQPKQHPWGQKQPQASGRPPQWGQVSVGDRTAKWGSDQSQQQAAGFARGQEVPPPSSQWTAGQGQRPVAPGSRGVGGDPEGGWSDAVPVLSEESSATMASLAVGLTDSKPLDLHLSLLASNTMLVAFAGPCTCGPLSCTLEYGCPSNMHPHLTCC